MISKADQLGESPSFAAAAAPPSDRRRLIADVTGDEGLLPPRTAPLTDLAHNPFNPRHTLTELQAMADSLLEQGQLSVLTVVTRDAFLAAHLPEHPDCAKELGAARFVVIDGNRRLGGARLAGLEEMRIDVNDDLASSAADVLEKALVIGIQHQSLSPLDEARALADLLKVHGSQRAVGRRISKSHVWVSQRLALLDLIPELQAALDAGELPVEDARTIARLPQDEQAAAVRTTEAERWDRNKERRPRGGRRDPARRPEGRQPDAGRGNAVSTPPPGGPAHDGPGARPDGMEPVAYGPAHDHPGGSPEGRQPGADAGNAVSTPPPGGPDISAFWDDLPALAALLREHLTADDRQALAGLLTAGG